MFSSYIRYYIISINTHTQLHIVRYYIIRMFDLRNTEVYLSYF